MNKNVRSYVAPRCIEVAVNLKSTCLQVVSPTLGIGDWEEDGEEIVIG